MTLEICRICGTTENLKHIFQEGDDELLDQIRLCVNIHIDALDSLPKFVCNACEHGLAFSYRLRKRGEETEKILRQELLGSTNSVPYHLAEDNTNDIDDVFMEELQEELWIKDEVDNSVHLNDDQDFIERDEDSDEGNITKESCDESEQWLVQDDGLIENTETMRDSDMKEAKEELEHMKQLDDNTLVKNEFNHTESQSLDGKNTNTTQIECETCAEVFQTRTKYFQHIKEHGDRRYHCVVCDKWFSRRYVFDQHIQNHYSKTGAFPCQKCNKSYTNHWNLERHARSAHRGEKGFRCGQCNSSFSRSDVLKMHMTKHFSDRNIECDICEKKFKTSQSLHFHKKSHLSKSERPKKPIRIKHKAKTKIELYICDVCEKVSHHRTTHLSHMRTHTGERPYHCSECDKSFKTSHARSSHMLTHTDQRPHECKTCGTSFRQTAHLKSHMLIHEGVKTHVCEVCNKAFRMKCNLIVHSRTHTGELPYKCNKCPEKFIRLTQVKRHNKNHTSAKKVQHELCNGNAHEMESDLNNSQISLYKLDRQLPEVDSTPGVSEEWGSGWNGPDFIVEVQETALNTGLRHGDAALNSTNHTEEGPKIIVRTEEVLIVGLVLMLWVGAIVLFFNRWGKIRMLEPYQPKFQQQHRSSCPLVDLDSLQSHPRASVSRMSMGYAGQLNIPACKFATYNPSLYTKAYPTYTRPRQNSVFVGPQVLLPKPPRKTRSAMDLHSMVLDESAEHV